MSEKRIEDHFNAIYGPIYKCQKFLACNRISVNENNRISGLSKWDKMYTCVWIIAVTYSIHHFISFYYSYYYEKSKILCIGCVLAITTQYLTYVVNIIYDKFLSKEADIDLILRLQKVDRSLNLQHSGIWFGKLRFFTIFILTVKIAPFYVGFAIHVLDYIEKPHKTVFFGLGLAVIYLDIFNTGFFLINLTLRLSFINDMIAKYNKIKIPHKKDTGIRRLTLTSKLCKIFTYYNKDFATFEIPNGPALVVDILKCYRLITKSNSLSIFLMTATVYMWTFIVIGSLVAGSRSETKVIQWRLQLFPVVAMITIAAWNVYYVIQLSALAFINDAFLMEVQNTKQLCIRMLAYTCDESVNKAASTIMKEIYYDPPEFSVYGIFIFDRSIILYLIGIITSNVMTVIQFTY